MSPKEEIPRHAGYFTYLKEAALEAYIDYSLEDENKTEISEQ